MVRGIPQAANHYLQGRTVMFDFRKMAVSLSVLSITAERLRLLKKQPFQRGSDMGLRRVW